MGLSVTFKGKILFKKAKSRLLPDKKVDYWSYFTGKVFNYAKVYIARTAVIRTGFRDIKLKNNEVN